jgi:type VI secretion system protein ImpE
VPRRRGRVEVLTSTGKYYLVPAERVVSIEFRPIERPCDLIWRRAEMVVEDGPEGEVFLSATYPPPPPALAEVLDDTARLARKTEWVGGDGQPVRGVGQRCFLLGEESVGMLELERLDFSPASS